MMSRAERFEDLVAWQKARALAARVHEVVNGATFQRDFCFRNQLWRAALSVPSNVAEGFERYGDGEFAHFLSIAKASCGEVRSHLYVALDIGYIDEATLHEVLGQAIECGRVIGRLRSAVDRRRRTRPSTQHPGLSTQHKRSSTQHTSSSTQHPALST